MKTVTTILAAAVILGGCATTNLPRKTADVSCSNIMIEPGLSYSVRKRLHENCLTGRDIRKMEYAPAVAKQIPEKTTTDTPKVEEKCKWAKDNKTGKCWSGARTIGTLALVVLGGAAIMALDAGMHHRPPKHGPRPPKHGPRPPRPPRRPPPRR